MAPLLTVSGLEVTYDSGVRAVAGVDLELARGETIGIVGESGCGKSTLGRAILQLQRPTAGSVSLYGEELTTTRGRRLRELRRQLQIVFQDPMASLNPRLSIGGAIADALKVHGMWDTHRGPERVAELLASVGLTSTAMSRYPHEFSGGQRQRIGIARALALEPDLLVLDEPVSALDVSVQADIVNLLDDLQQQLGVAYLFIAHDLAVVRHVADRVAVMYLGKIVESGPVHSVYEAPGHPYSLALLSASPELADGGMQHAVRVGVTGEPPDPAAPPSGCRFRTRCWKATERCADEEPVLLDRGGSAVACHHPVIDPMRELEEAERFARESRDRPGAVSFDVVRARIDEAADTFGEPDGAPVDARRWTLLLGGFLAAALLYGGSTGASSQWHPGATALAAAIFTAVVLVVELLPTVASRRRRITKDRRR